jgi:hypothetical protein
VGIMNRMSTARTVAILFLSVLLMQPGAAQAQEAEDSRYFPETGHSVEGDFLQFYRNTNHAELVFGFPITEQFISTEGKRVQYFQRARFEMNPVAQGPAAVQLTPLGSLLYEAGSQKLDINNPAACREFPNGFHVCFAFLDFYEAHGGQELFGNPISSFEFHENLIVQYFERARFEWRADRPDGERVVLTDLGRLYFDRVLEDQAQLRPIRPLDATINPILSLHARAFVIDAITLADGQQTVHVFVQSQTHQPVSNANGKATIRFPDNQVVEYFFGTNSRGLGSFTFSFKDQIQGELVQIDILVTYQGLVSRTSTSYRIWY